MGNVIVNQRERFVLRDWEGFGCEWSVGKKKLLRNIFKEK